MVCAMAAATAAAYCMGAFEFLKERDEYAYLGMNEIYETYAKKVEKSDGERGRGHRRPGGHGQDLLHDFLLSPFPGAGGDTGGAGAAPGGKAG